MVTRNSKARLRFTRKGWFVRWLDIACGAVDARTGRVQPDQDGAIGRVIWVGPYRSAGDAMCNPIVRETFKREG